MVVLQIVLSFLLYGPSGFEVVRNIGWVVLWISAIFGWVPIYTLHRKGGVPRGKSYVHTTVLVDTGIYAVVRHPQYAAGMLMSLALILIAQRWLITAIGIAAIALNYMDIIRADEELIRKFGDPYRSYMKAVPRTDFVLGLTRLVQRRRRARKNQASAND